MTLKKKYCNLIDYDSGYDNELLADKCDKIAEEFSIGFAEWKDKFISELADWKQDGVYLKDKYSTKELLQIYKEEKGL